MTTVAAERYRLPDTDIGAGVDLLLDRPVGFIRLATTRPGRLARGLRQLPASPWLRILDAYVVDDQVAVVLPYSDITLEESLAAGLSAQRRALLADALRPALSQLEALGLRPATLDPRDVGATRRGQVLLTPMVGPASDASELEWVLGSIRASGIQSAEPTVTSIGGDAPVDSLDDHAGSGGSVRLAGSLAAATDHGQAADWPPAAVDGHDGAPVSAPVAAPTSVPLRSLRSVQPGRMRAAVTARPIAEADRPGARSNGRLRTAVIALGTAAFVLGAGVIVTADDRRPAVADGAAAAPTQETVLIGSIERLSASAGTAGPGGPELEDRLRDALASRGAAQLYTAAGALEYIRVGRRDGTLTGPRVAEVEAAAAPLARPADLDSLISMMEVAPRVYGKGAPALLGPLRELRTLTGQPARTQAQDLSLLIEAGEGKGQLTPTFADLALPVLRKAAPNTGRVSSAQGQSSATNEGPS